ncbi:MAG: double zinc ribbon domain-containing protein [Alphaproteobacteria bacterium]
MNAELQMIACPFCAASDPGKVCAGCGRDKAAARRICTACRAQTPVGDAACHACGARRGNELRWKIPLIVGLFVAAFVAAVAINVFMQ